MNNPMMPLGDIKLHSADVNTVDCSFRIKELILTSSSDGFIKILNTVTKQTAGSMNLGFPINMATWHPAEYFYDQVKFVWMLL